MAFSQQKAAGTVRMIQGAKPVTLWEVAGQLWCKETMLVNCDE